MRSRRASTGIITKRASRRAHTHSRPIWCTGRRTLLVRMACPTPVLLLQPRGGLPLPQRTGLPTAAVTRAALRLPRLLRARRRTGGRQATLPTAGRTRTLRLRTLPRTMSATADRHLPGLLRTAGTTAHAGARLPLPLPLTATTRSGQGGPMAHLLPATPTMPSLTIGGSRERAHRWAAGTGRTRRQQSRIAIVAGRLGPATSNRRGKMESEGDPQWRRVDLLARANRG